MAQDPVALIQGQSALPTTVRCRHCGAQQTLAGPLPTWGVSCGQCQEQIGARDQVTYAGLKARSLALLADTAFLIVPIAFLDVMLIFFMPVVPTDEQGYPTYGATIALNTIGAILLVVHVSLGEMLGQTVGKRFVGMHVVRGLVGETRCARRVASRGRDVAHHCDPGYRIRGHGVR